jgi:hypothetical protein
MSAPIRYIIGPGCAVPATELSEGTWLLIRGRANIETGRDYAFDNPTYPNRPIPASWIAEHKLTGVVIATTAGAHAFHDDDGGIYFETLWLR